MSGDLSKNLLALETGTMPNMLLVSPRNFAKYDQDHVFYFMPHARPNEIIALAIESSIYCPDHCGYVFIDGKFIKTIDLEDV